jgi:hypothetical protein
MSVFKEATKQHLIFNLGHGVVSTEDLWQYPLEKLNTLYMELHKLKEDSCGVSLLATKSSNTQKLELQLDVIKEIVEDKLAEKEAKKRKQQEIEEAKFEEQILLESIYEDKVSALKSLSLEEKRKKLAELKA